MPGPSYILALDTAMQGCSVAVLDVQSGVSVEKSEAMGRGQSERLVPMVDEVLAQVGIAYSDLSLVAVTVGPGAFTGLRIGISAARAFGTALDIPVTGVTTTEVLARQYAKEAKAPFAVILETKRSDFYVQFFDERGVSQSAPEACDAEVIADRMKPGIAIIGDGAGRFNDLRESTFTSAIVAGYDLPDPRMVAEIGVAHMTSGTIQPADPLYLREADVSQSKKIQRSIADH